ncbi:transposase [Microseira wollei NIES-4236]|uniref:Transposase n=1 Tax=Microseira wollei NIES-4236 TaxID=2530354 RepID=A0AAV3X6Q2_9CYAN|nr:transposase family protein [Microseira wollei]GET37804.1 transposase [Microseira wollei NIES-4236]
MTKILNLPGVIVEDSKETKETLILSVNLEKKTATCPRCGEISHRIHQNKSHLVRDLPMGDREVVLKLNRRRFKCEKCQKPFSETLNFVGERKRFTYRYTEAITEQVIHSDVSKAKNNRLTEEEVWSMVIAVAQKILPVNVK